MKNNNLSILLVDDDEVDVMNVKRAFKKVKITNPLHVAGDGLQALNMLRGDGAPRLVPTPRIILLDISMPRMNGIEFLKELRHDAEFKSISVFVLTTSNEETDKIAAYNLNVAGYILKPVDPECFIDAVTTLDYYWSIIELA